ncbi:hypothetical protein C8Q77DRAFT_506369 [Trametes polyzona]|nr:hypothetical protein C8Q77DRAFT_506369 [Trametes polyzona]
MENTQATGSASLESPPDHGYNRPSQSLSPSLQNQQPLYPRVAAFAKAVEGVLTDALARGDFAETVAQLRLQLAQPGIDPSHLGLVNNLVARVSGTAEAVDDGPRSALEPRLVCARCNQTYRASENTGVPCIVLHSREMQNIVIRGDKAGYPAAVYPCCGLAFVNLPGIPLAVPPFCYAGPHEPLAAAASVSRL